MNSTVDDTPPTGRVRADIDLAAIRSNVRELRRRAVGGAGLMAVVKADAYGHGMVPSARAARSGGADWLGTATPEEALALRAAGDTGRLLCWLWTPDGPWREAVEADIDVSVGGRWALDRVVGAARAAGRTARIHLKADTGLGRGGCQPDDWPSLAAATRAAEAEGAVRAVGVWSHLACADEPGHPAVARQEEAFRAALTAAERAGIAPEVRHLANSPATLTLPGSHYDLVRPGLSVYGLSPSPEVGTAEEYGLRPAMTLRASLAGVKTVPAGHGVSYGHTQVTAAATTLGLVPVGYADGVPRHASNSGPVLVAGEWRTVVGRVAMDQFVVDLGSELAEPGEPAVLFGPGDAGEPTVEDWARAAGTIGYEIVSRIGGRVPRHYRDGGQHSSAAETGAANSVGTGESPGPAAPGERAGSAVPGEASGAVGSAEPVGAAGRAPSRGGE